MKRLFNFLKQRSVYTLSIVLIFFFFIGGIGVFYLSMRRISDKALENELLVMDGTIKMRIANSISKELALTLKMSDSELIKRYFKYPDNANFKEIAFEEFASYGRSFTNNSVFWINNQDKIFYIDNIAYYTLESKSPEDLMYNMTMYHTEKYNFFINYNHISSSLDLWLNVPVYDRDIPLGVLGTYFDLKNFINELYNNININSDIYIFNRFIEITLARDVELAEKKVYITDRFPDVTGEITRFLDQPAPQEPHIYSRGDAKYILSYIPLLDWYVAGRLPVTSPLLFDVAMTGLFLVVLLLILLIFFGFSLFAGTMRKQTLRLMQLNRAAVAASQAKNNFLAKISHEIRTPMNSVIGMSELAIREYGKPQGLEYLAHIKLAGAHLLAIINDILDFSKMESGNLQFNDAPYQTASLLNDVLAIIQVRLGEKTVDFIADIAPDLPASLMGDETRVRQVLLNVLGNAVKYTDSGFISFTARGERVENDAIRLTFVVADTGTGIRKKDMPALFGEFSRIDRERNRHIEGSGLGLSIARTLCRTMNGDIAVTSQYGRGSTFTLTFLQGIVDSTPMGCLRGKAAARLRPDGLRFTAPGFRVLIVDDLATNLKVAEGLLAPYKMDVTTCLSGARAIELVMENGFDLVLMDHMMPGMDGIETVKRIRNMEGGRFGKLPVVALTANAVAGMREMFLQKGFDDYLAKPIELAKLSEIMERWVPVDKRGQAAGGEEQAAASADFSAKFSIAGLDIGQGLAMAGGTVDTYREILALYCRDAAGRMDSLNAAPDEANLEMFSAQAHALKSASANIGAKVLAGELAALEAAGARGDLAAVAGLAPACREELAALLKRIHAALPPVAVHNPAEEYVLADPALLAQLQEALETRRVTVADDILKTLAGLSLAPALKADLTAISDHILMAEFDKAALAVSVLRRRV